MLDMVTLLQTQRAKHGPRPLFGRKVGSAWRYETYEDFGQRVDACRARLATLDVAPGERVAIISGNCIEWVAYCFAAYGLRAAWVPMYAAQLEDDWMYILRDSGARICLVEDEALESRIAARRSFTATTDRTRSRSWRRTSRSSAPGPKRTHRTSCPTHLSSRTHAYSAASWPTLNATSPT